MRSVTAAASSREGASTCGKVSGRPARMRTLRGRMRQPRRTSVVPITASGTTGAPVSSASRPTPRLARAGRAGPHARALGEDQHAVAAREDRLGGVDHVLVGVAAVDREGAERVEQPRLQAVAEQLLLGDVVDRPPHHRRRSRTGRGSCGGWPRRSPGRPAGCARARCARGGSRGGRTAAGPRGRASRRSGSRRARVRADAGRRDPSPVTYPCAGVGVTVAGRWRSSRTDAAGRAGRRDRRGAVGAAAAARQAGASGAATTTSSCSGGRCGRARGRVRWYPLGLALHVQNGALFGAVYAARRRRALSLASRPSCADRSSRWSSTSGCGRSGALSDRFHPARAHAAAA